MKKPLALLLVVILLAISTASARQVVYRNGHTRNAHATARVGNNDHLINFAPRFQQYPQAQRRYQQAYQPPCQGNQYAGNQVIYAYTTGNRNPYPRPGIQPRQRYRQTPDYGAVRQTYRRGYSSRYSNGYRY